MSNIYKLGTKIGLSRKDIDNVIFNSNKNLEQVNYSCGPHWYPGGKYGTVSVKDFY